ncbi:MAG: carboxypeptidase-like regulatory domain-containing protein [Planctomycetota bacterium]
MKSCTFVILVASGLFPFAGCSSSSRDMSKLKEELKQEILAELRQQGEIPEQDLSQKALEPAREEVCQQEKVEIVSDLRVKIGSHIQNPDQTTANVSALAADHSRRPQSRPVGKAAGYILRGGKGLEACEVKLARMLTGRSAIEIFSAVREGTEFTTTTDGQGRYAFNRLPAGSYKLKWQLPGNKGWIRRLQDRPDAIITDGQTTTLKSVETERRLVGR